LTGEAYHQAQSLSSSTKLIIKHKAYHQARSLSSSTKLIIKHEAYHQARFMDTLDIGRELNR
jgi:hypothetical protein